MKRARCREAFEVMQKKRLSYPLKSGIYKIEEIRREFERFSKKINILGENRRRKIVSPPIIGQDAYRWLKKIPLEIAEKMGYTALPGMQMLHGDDVPEETIKMLQAKYIPQMEELIDKCDAVESRLRKNIGFEYRKWEYGESDLLDLINDAQSIIYGILKYAKPA